MEEKVEGSGLPDKEVYDYVFIRFKINPSAFGDKFRWLPRGSVD